MTSSKADDMGHINVILDAHHTLLVRVDAYF